MSNPQQVPTILAIIEDGTEYTIRASGEFGKRLATSVMPMIPQATKVTFVTDTDIKVFKKEPSKQKPIVPTAEMTSNEEKKEEIPENTPQRKTLKASQRIIQDESAPPAPELVDEENEEELLRQMEAEEKQVQAMQRLNRQEAFPVQEEEIEEQSASTPRKRETPKATGSAVCGRCGGAGEVIGDSGMQGKCPVCKGKGKINSWGRGRSGGGPTSFKHRAR